MDHWDQHETDLTLCMDMSHIDDSRSIRAYCFIFHGPIAQMEMYFVPRGKVIFFFMFPLEFTTGNPLIPFAEMG